jgi:hypothetical protein
MTRQNEQYPELADAAETIASMTAAAINVLSLRTESEMPYKTQAILERVISLLQERV